MRPRESARNCRCGEPATRQVCWGWPGFQLTLLGESVTLRAAMAAALAISRRPGLCHYGYDSDGGRSV
jgi:hypothetical protein